MVSSFPRYWKSNTKSKDDSPEVAASKEGGDTLVPMVEWGTTRKTSGSYRGCFYLETNGPVENAE
jgi:hypothetical protein